MRLTKKDRFIVSCENPCFEFSDTEIKESYEKAKGHYWRDDEQEEYVSVCPVGRAEKFEYFSSSDELNDLKFRKQVRKAASLWSMGEYNKANKIFSFDPSGN